MLQEIVDEEVDDQYDDDEEDYHRHDESDLVNSKTINDILKYGAGHHSMDSNPGETQSEWSDEDEKEDDEAKGTHLFDIEMSSFLSTLYFSFFYFKAALKAPATSPMNLA